MISEKTIGIVKATASVVAVHAEAITRRFYTLMFIGEPPREWLQECLTYQSYSHQQSR